MDSGLYAAYTGLLARNETLDAAASNLANASTSGFRAQRYYFREILAGNEAATSQLGQAANTYSMLGGNIVSLGEGQLSPTGNSLDVAIQGTGFFGIEGSHGTRYTRDGGFRTGLDGTLETMSGEAVLSTTDKKIVLPAGDVTISIDGSVSVGGVIAGQIGVFSLPAISIKPDGINRYEAVGDAKPVVDATSALRQGSLESSNQDVVQGSLQLVLIQRQAEMMQKALGIFSGTLDRLASEDLPKV